MGGRGVSQTVASTREPSETLRPDSLSAQMASLSDLTALRPWNALKVNQEETKRKEGAQERVVSNAF